MTITDILKIKLAQLPEKDKTIIKNAILNEYFGIDVAITGKISSEGYSCLQEILEILKLLD